MSKKGIKIDDDLIDAQRVLINPLNNSSSKQQFSFTKSKRWNERPHTQMSQYKYYDLPSTKSKIGPIMPSSKRNIFNNKNDLPPPNSYNYAIQGQFGYSKQHKKGFYFALGRDVDKFKYRNQKSIGPDAATYDSNRSSIEDHGFSFTKQKKDINKSLPKINIGPGDYKISTSLDEKDQILSTQPKNGAPKLVQLKQKKKKKNKKLESPLYCPKITSKGDKLQFKNKNGIIIGSSKRADLVSKSVAPGPGRYKIFSQFPTKGKI